VRVVSNYRFAAEPYILIEPAGMTRLLLSDNGVSAPIALPFPFRFYGVEKSSLYVAANGVLGFSPEGLATTENLAMPNGATPNDIIAPYWDNLDPSASGNVYWGTVGTAPNRKFVVSWVNVPRVSSTVYLSFQAILEESTGDIVFQYKDVAGTRGAGKGATVGVENSLGEIAALYLHNGSPYLLESRTALRASRGAFRYLVLDKSSLWFDALQGSTANSHAVVALENTGNLDLNWSVSSGNSWLTISNWSGALAGGQTIQLDVALDPSTTTLAPGSYETSLTVSNLTDGSGTVTIPVTIRLAPSAAAGVLEFTPASSNLFAGGLGGPFQPSAVPVQIRNSGNASLNWSATADNPWVEAAPSSGVLAAGEAATVLLDLTTLAETLPTGEHTATVRFVNDSVAGSAAFSQAVRVQVNSRLGSSASVQNGQFRAELSAPAAGNYAVEYSTDFQNWQTLSTVSAVNGMVTFDDAIGGESKRFYRLRLL
jgi:hypothetical protein